MAHSRQPNNLKPKGILKCDFCNSAEMKMAYKVPSSHMGAKVFVCSNCGLAQSSFSKLGKSKAERKVSVSGQADWGNIRYGKAFRTQEHLKLLDKFIPWSKVRNVLDIGSSRGDFVKGIYDKGDFAITAIEPDATVSPKYDEYPRVKYYNERVENIEFKGQSFGLIYMSHTFEHLGSPFATLNKITQTPGSIKGKSDDMNKSENINKNTYLLVEVPDLAFIGQKDVIEEFFIDKHTFHFTRTTLKNYLKHFGFEILYENSASATNDVTIIARLNIENDKKGVAADKKETGATKKEAKADKKEVKAAAQLIKKYIANRKKNMVRMKKVARYIESFYPKRIAIWGAGRIFDSLVVFGGLKLGKISLVIDQYLPDYVKQAHGKPIIKPGDADFKSIDLLVVMSREYADEITSSARRMGFHRPILNYSAVLGKV